MVLHVDSDAAYLVLPQACSRIAGHNYFSDRPTKTKTPTANDPILTECRSLRHVVASAAKAEIGGLFHNARTTIPIRQSLEVLDHPQPPTPIKTVNSTTKAFVTKNLRQKQSKSWNMRYHWLLDRINQKHFQVFWKIGKTNWADYFTKHHSIKQHKVMRPKYIHMNNCLKQQRCEQQIKSPTSPRGYVDIRALVRTRMTSYSSQPKHVSDAFVKSPPMPTNLDSLINLLS